MDSCCEKPKKESKGILSGIVYGIIPHSFCIAFIAFSAIGSALMAGIFKQILVIPYFFEILLAASFIMATVSAGLYLKKTNCLCRQGIKSKWKYLAILYGATILTNVAMVSYILPAMANPNSVQIGAATKQLAEISLKVEIPCSGHAPIIMDELKKDSGIKNIVFKNPNIFQISFDPQVTTAQKITAMEIFKTYKAYIN